MRLLRIRSTGLATRLIRVSRSCFCTLLIWQDPTFLRRGVRTGEIHRCDSHMVTHGYTRGTCDMQRHDWSSTSPKEPMLHLSLSPCTDYQLQLASSSRHWCLHIEQPQAQHPPTSTHYYEFTSPPEVWDLLVSDASWYHHREAQNHSPEHSLSPFLAGGMIFPLPSGILDPCQFSSNNWKLISFNSTWLHKKIIIIYIYIYGTFTFSKSSSFSLSFSPSLASMYLFEQCLRLGVIGTSSVCLPLQD